MATIPEALQEKCSRCGMLPTQWCVYVMPNAYGYPPEQIIANWPSLRDKVERVGQPTRVLHPERFAEAGRRAEATKRANLRAQRAVERAELATARIMNLDIDLARAWTAEREFARRERDQLSSWLRLYGAILIETEEQES